MLDNQYRYEAFISYRHQSPDADIAKTLHRQIEQFKIPGAIAKQVGKKRMGKVFRDQDELPTSGDLGSDIESALRDSKWLIVICSPDLPKSKWCMKEVDAFIAMGRRDRILTLLVRGEPDESFPQQIRFVDIDGILTEREPLAADVRAPDLSGMKRKLNIEKLRILAPMLGVGFDDLRQRAREQRLQTLVAFSAAVVTLVTAFAIYAVTQNRIIAYQRNRAVENELMLWLEKSVLASSADDKLGGLVHALQAQEAGEMIVHQHQTEIQDALEMGLYSEEFRQVSVIKNKGMRMGQLTYSPDGKWVLGIINQNAAALMDAYSGEILRTVGNHRESLTAVGFSPDSSRFYTFCGWENRIAVWDCETGDLIGQYLREDEYSWTIGCVGFLGGPDQLLVYENEHLIVWDLQKSKETNVLDMDGRVFTDTGIALNPSADQVAFSSSMAEDLWLYDLKTDTQRELENPDGSTANRLTFSPDGKWIAAGLGPFVAVWDASSGQLITRTPVTNAAAIYSLRISPDSKQLVYVEETRIVMLDPMSGEIIWIYNDPYPNQIYAVEFSPDGSSLLARHLYAVLLDVRNGNVLHDFGDMEVQGAVFDPSGATILFSLYDGGFGGYATPLGASVQRLDAYSGNLYRVERFTPIPEEKSHLISLHDPGTQVPPGQSRIFTAPNSRYAALAHGDGFIEVWDLSTAQTPAYGIAEHYQVVNDILFTETIMASGGRDGRVMIFDLEQGQLRFALTLGNTIHRLEISPDSTKLMALHDDGTSATVVSTVSGGILFELDGKGSPIKDMGFSVDGKQAVIITENGSAWIGQMHTEFADLLQASRVRVGQ
jgi:WD40 repeat protein